VLLFGFIQKLADCLWENRWCCKLTHFTALMGGLPCVAQRVSKNLKNIVKDMVRSHNEQAGDLSVKILLFYYNIMFKSQLIKSN
jgi:hypothetical protein